MNTLLPIAKVTRVPAPRPVDKWDALERFAAAMQSIKSSKEEIASGIEWVRQYPEDAEASSDDHFWEKRLKEAIGSAHIALNQLPPEWRQLFSPELTAAIQST